MDPEIKLEQYNFLGQTIDYENEKFELDSLDLPDNYFAAEVHQPFESDEDDDGDRQVNGVGVFVPQCNSSVINIADESSDDDDVNEVVDLNSSGENIMANTSNISIRANIDSIRSDHNYSSQELFAESFSETMAPPPAPPITPAPPQIVQESEQANEPIDHVNEMQALVATFMTDATDETKAIILTDLENEIKRIKTTMLGQQSRESASVASDENYIMSEGHSEPLEYRAGGVVLPETETEEPESQLVEEAEEAKTEETACEHSDSEAFKTFKNVRSIVEKLSAKVTNFSKFFCANPFTDDTAKTELTELSDGGNELVESLKAMAVSLKIDVSDVVSENTEINGNAAEPMEDEATTESADVSAINELTNGNSPNDSEDRINGNSNEEVSAKQGDEETAPSVNEDITNTADAPTVDGDEDEDADDGAIVDDAVVDDNAVADDDVDDDDLDDGDDKTTVTATTTVDKQQLDLNSKKRWLASSSEDESSSDESISENVPVKRRKKRPRNSSSSDDQANKGRKKQNVLLDSTDDERSENGAISSTELDNDENEDDINMSKYLLLPDVPTGVTVGDGDDNRVDSEVEEFFGFDGPACDSEVLSFNGEIVESRKAVVEPTIEPIVEEDTDDLTEAMEAMEAEEVTKAMEGTEATETATDSTVIDEPMCSEVIVTEEAEERDEPEPPYVQSQQWELPQRKSVDENSVAESSVAESSVDENGVAENNVETVEEVVCKTENVEEVVCKTEIVDEEKQSEENGPSVQEDDEEASGYDTDDEINRLVDLSTIPTRTRPVVNYVPVFKKKTVSKPKPKEDILDLLKDSVSQDVESESSSEEEMISEEQYVLQMSKQQCLKDSSDSDVGDDDVDSTDENESSIDDENDLSNDSTKLNKFLKKRLVNEIENDLASEEKAAEGVAKENRVDENEEENEEDEDEEDEKNEPENELQSSGIFEPEIELHDGEKQQDSDDDDELTDDKKPEPHPQQEEEQQQQQQHEQEKAPVEEKKKWKLDKIAFNKNLFNDLNDLDDEPNVKASPNSDNSDCEMLDISMFKTKKSGADLDKIIQNQKKRDVSSKVSSKVADECISLSSDSDLEIDKGTIDDDSEDDKPTTKSRPMLRNDQLAGETKQAQKEETDRLKRLEKKNDRLTQIVETQSERLSQSNDLSDVILDFDTKQNCAISVHPEIVKNLKEHQVSYFVYGLGGHNLCNLKI